MRTTLGLSARNRRILALGIRGGADDTPTPVADLLTQAGAVQDLADDDLGALDELLTDAMREALSGVVTDADLALADEIQTARLAVLTAADERMTAQADRDARAQELLASITPNEPEPEPETPETPEVPEEPESPEAVEVPAPVVEIAPEPEAPAEPEKIAATATSVVTRVEARRAAPRPVRAAAPAPEFVLRASANVPGMQPGERLDSTDKIITAWERAWEASRGWAGEGRFRTPVAQLGAYNAEDMYGPDRFLDGDAARNQVKIDAVVGRQALRASGGICAPSVINYDQPVVGTDARPFRDGMMARYGADRGGVTTFPPPQLYDAAVIAANTLWTNANDTTPASPTTKNVTTMTCPTGETTVVQAIVDIVKIGNFRARFFREQVEAFMSKVAQNHARVAENALIAAVGAGSTQVAHQTVLGTTRDVLAHIDLTAAQMRSRYRLAPDSPLRLGFPDWLLDNMRVDLTREAPGSTAERLATSEAEIQGWFAARNINTTWFLDGESTQIFGAQADGAAVGWPNHVYGYIFPEGEWLFLDGGTLDLGMVRDSTLNATNDFEFFTETFEGAHRLNAGPSYRLDIDICPTGKTSLPVSIDPCAGGS